MEGPGPAAGVIVGTNRCWRTRPRQESPITTPLRARLIALRHEDLLGSPVRSFRVARGPMVPILMLVAIAVVVVAGLIHDAGGTATVLGIGGGIGVLMLLIWLWLTDIHLVVFTRGILLGRLIPGLPLSPTYVLSTHEIDPDTVCIVSSGPKAGRQLGMPRRFPQFFTTLGPSRVQAVLFQGPSGADVTTGRSPGLREISPASPFLFSSRRAHRLAVELLAMLLSTGRLPEDFQPANDLQSIPVTGRRHDPHGQLPGTWRTSGL